ncbi:MAG TPA: hypothetical protein VGR40_06010, partial [Candidatus Binatus sp.]|nr:hypothetical protein [Candidatus Binatus sp.]
MELDDRRRHYSDLAAAPTGLIAIPHCAQKFESAATRIPHCGQNAGLRDDDNDGVDTAACAGAGCGGRGGSVWRIKVGTVSVRRGASEGLRGPGVSGVTEVFFGFSPCAWIFWIAAIAVSARTS